MAAMKETLTGLLSNPMLSPIYLQQYNPPGKHNLIFGPCAQGFPLECLWTEAQTHLSAAAGG